MECCVRYSINIGLGLEYTMPYQGIVIWNSLSLNMKMALSLSSFNRQYIEEQFSTLWPEALKV